MKRSLNPVLAVWFVLSLCLTPMAGVASTEVAPQAPQATTAPTCITTRISASSDDAEERNDTGAVDLDGDTATHSLQMYRIYSGSSTSTLNWWGLRFLNVDVPQGAMIASATVTFRANEASAAIASGMTLWGQLAVNPATFTASPNNITGRTRTTATATWSVPQWTSGSDYSPPATLAAIVQEIVDQSGWAANNALVIIGQTTMTQNRSAISRDSTNGETLAPLLEVCYTQTPAGPTIATVGALTVFGTPPGVASAAQTYTVSGSNLAADIVIGPPAGFEVSIDGSTYSSSLTLPQSGGSVASTAVYVRLYSAMEGTFSGSIANTSSDATTQDVAVSGRVGYCATASLVVAEDTHMRSGYARPSLNYGGSTTVRVNPYYESGSTDGQLTGALLKWDISSARIPADATVSAASLSFYVTDGSNYAYSLYNMRRAWVEGTNNGAPGTGASWNYYGAGTGSWGTTGAQNTSSDRYDTNLWDATASNFNTTGSVTFDLNTSGLAVIQGWIAGSDNYGLTIQNYSGTTIDVWEAASSEATTEANRPRLTINYCASASPTVNTGGTLTAFSSSPEVPSTEQNYTVSGYNLTADIVVTAPADFEISTTSESGFASSLTLLQSGGSVAATRIYVRFNRGTLGTSSGNITHISIGATTENVAVTGTASPANHAPYPPVLVQPEDDATGVSTSSLLEVTVTDPDADTVSVSFYGRAVSANTPEDFTVIALPDTQNYSTAYPAVFIRQTQWIVSNKTPLNIAFVTHLGDIVNIADSTTEYDNADAAMDLLDAGNVAYSMGPGNHDYPLTNYNSYFGVSRFLGKSWYGGNYNDSNENNYSLFSASGMDFILINLEYHPGTAVMDWADARLKEFSTRQAIVATHSIINIDNNWTYPAVYTALKDNPNLFLMLCGHMHTETDGAGQRTEAGDNGNTVHILQSDYQDFTPYWGNGYLRIMRFSPVNDKIFVTTYSPYLSGSLTDVENQFELAYEMAGPPTFELIGTVSGVVSGGNASISWPGRAQGTEYVWYVVANDGTTTTTGSTWSFTTAAQVNNAPVVDDIPDQTNAEGATFAAITLDDYVADVDNTDAEMTWNYSGNSALSVSIVNRVATITAPSADWNGSEMIIFRATDPDDLWDEDTATFAVTAVNDAPVLDPVGNQTVVAATPLTFDASASDPDLPIQTLTFSLTDGAPDGAAIDPDTGVFTWTPTEAQVTTHSVTVRVSDGALNDEETIQITVLAPLTVTVLGLRQSPDETTWTPVDGDLARGYMVALDGLATSWRYLDVASLTVNRGTLADGFYGFRLAQTDLPDDWLAYWDVRGVNAGATGWQGQMWQIINGEAPIFHLKVSSSSYMLVDGLRRAMGDGDHYLRVNGDYPLGTYSYSGSVADLEGGSAAVTAKMTFVGPDVPAAPVITVSRSGQNVLVTWLPVTTDKHGKFTLVTEYLVYVDGQPYFDPGSVTPTHVDSAVYEYSDVGLIGSLTNHYYIVRAVNTVGPSADSKRVGKFTFQLVPGQ